MRINTNLLAMNSLNNLYRTGLGQASALERLSSGKRINRSADDAAGYAIARKMLLQSSGLQKASKNSLDGISLIQTAEGALNEVHSMLQRMRELSVQAANGSNVLEDREAIQAEINQLTSEINRVRETTEFNKQKVFSNRYDDGSAKPNMDIPVQAGANAKQMIDVHFEEVSAYTLNISGTIPNGRIIGENEDGKPMVIGSKSDHAMPATITVTTSGLEPALAGVLDGMVIDSSAGNNRTKEDFPESDFESIYEKTPIDPADLSQGYTYSLKKEYKDTIDPATGIQKNTILGRREDITIDGKNIQLDFIKVGPGENDFDVFIFNREPGGTLEPIKKAFFSKDLLEHRYDNHPEEYAISVTKQESANDAIRIYNDAIAKISKLRSSLGAAQNRLEHTIKSVDVAAENVTDSMSRIQDADMSFEMTEFTKYNIMQQSGNAMLVQANQIPQMVLKLLES